MKPMTHCSHTSLNGGGWDKRALIGNSGRELRLPGRSRLDAIHAARTGYSLTDIKADLERLGSNKRDMAGRLGEMS
jgi:hypothetical protein